MTVLTVCTRQVGQCWGCHALRSTGSFIAILSGLGYLDSLDRALFGKLTPVRMRSSLRKGGLAPVVSGLTLPVGDSALFSFDDCWWRCTVGQLCLSCMVAVGQLMMHW